MLSRRYLLLVVVAACSSVGATHRTQNFAITAANDKIAQQVGHYAEKYRKEKAIEWLGQEMPAWGRQCPLQVTVTPGSPGGATTFNFDRGQILDMHMNVQGPLDRILASVLPHEITHTVFAYHFRCPLPRWADEGGSVLSEDDEERRRHDGLVRQCLAGGRAFRLRILLDMMQYPSSGGDVMTLYAQGYSLARFCVEMSSKPGLLNFVADGMRRGWDQAVQTHFRLNRVEDLEEKWLEWLRGNFRPTVNVLVGQQKPASNQANAVRSGAHPLVELGPPQVDASQPRVIRAAMPDDEPKPQPRQPQIGVTPSREGWSPVAPTVLPPQTSPAFLSAPPRATPAVAPPQSSWQPRP
jgi:hypothetical protein